MAKHEVYWYREGKPETTPLREDISTDVAIVGGGMAGLVAAYKLSVQGLKVVVLEKDFCGGGATGKSSGFITPDSELEFTHLVARFGVDEACKLWRFAVSGVDEIRHIIEKEKIKCDYQIQDSLFIANSDKAFKVVEKEYALQSKSFTGSSLYLKNEIPKVIGSHGYAGGIRCKGTFGMNGYLFSQGIKRALEKKGVRIFEGTEVASVSEKVILTKAGNTVKADTIIVTLDRFLPRLGIYPKEVYSAQTFLSISRVLADAEIKAIFPERNLMVWDTDLIYQYFRITGEKRLLFGAASMLYTYLPFSYEKGAARIEKKIQRYIEKKFDGLPAPIDIEYIWPGLIGVTKDFLPLCGKIRDKEIYYISGVAGLPWAAACAGYIADKATSQRDDLDHYFAAKRRFPLGRKIQAILSKPVTFALSHGLVKYFRK